MADGTPMQARFAAGEAPAELDEAIRKLEAGGGDSLVVDLGGGRIARPDSPRGTAGLLQRLRGHKMLMAQAEAGTDLSRFKSRTEVLQVAPAVREILDAAGRKS